MKMNRGQHHGREIILKLLLKQETGSCWQDIPKGSSATEEKVARETPMEFINF